MSAVIISVSSRKRSDIVSSRLSIYTSVFCVEQPMKSVRSMQLVKTAMVLIFVICPADLQIPSSVFCWITFVVITKFHWDVLFALLPDVLLNLKIQTHFLLKLLTLGPHFFVLTVKNIPFNFVVYYHCVCILTALVFIFPLFYEMPTICLLIFDVSQFSPKNQSIKCINYLFMQQCIWKF